MGLYFQNYSSVLKKNFMLVLMALVLLVFTFFIWVGVPVFIIGGYVSELTSNIVLIHMSISLSVGILFSLFFLPINLQVAKNVAVRKKRSVRLSFMRIELIWVFICSFIFEVIILLILL